MKTIRVGVIGVGHLGQHHARIFGALPGVELVGVADARPEQARAVAERCGCRVVDEYRELVDQVDAISVAVPTSAHRSVASVFLDHGIPTLIEKPLAPTLADAEALVDLARSRGALLQVGHIERFNPALSALEGFRVRPKFIAAERLGTYTFRSTDIGVVLDLMIHDLDLILSWLPTPVRTVSAVGVSVFGGHEDIAEARIEFEDGCVANLTASRVSMQATRKLRIWGSEGYAALDFAAKRGTLVRPSDRLRRGEIDLQGVDLSQPATVRDHLFGKILRVDRVEAQGREPLALELEDFIEAIREGTRPRVTGDDAVRAIRVADQILRSLRTHRWEGHSDGPIGPLDVPAPLAEPIAGLQGPKSWKIRSARHEPSTEV